jgi:hypothetical protein
VGMPPVLAYPLAAVMFVTGVGLIASRRSGMASEVTDGEADALRPYPAGRRGGRLAEESA